MKWNLLRINNRIWMFKQHREVIALATFLIGIFLSSVKILIHASIKNILTLFLFLHLRFFSIQLVHIFSDGLTFIWSVCFCYRAKYVFQNYLRYSNDRELTRTISCFESRLLVIYKNCSINMVKTFKETGLQQTDTRPTETK